MNSCAILVHIFGPAYFQNSKKRYEENKRDCEEKSSQSDLTPKMQTSFYSGPGLADGHEVLPVVQ